jgi:hypothetical protein
MNNWRKKMSDLRSKYELIELDEKQHAFRLIDGKFKDVIYKYNRFGLVEPEEGEETLKYRFEYDIIEIPEEIRGKKYSDKEGLEFEKLIGDILIQVLEENVEFEEEDDDKTRRYNFKKSNIL